MFAAALKIPTEWFPAAGTCFQSDTSQHTELNMCTFLTWPETQLYINYHVNVTAHCVNKQILWELVCHNNFIMSNLYQFPFFTAPDDTADTPTQSEVT